jgi:hypothetical protein
VIQGAIVVFYTNTGTGSFPDGFEPPTRWRCHPQSPLFCFQLRSNKWRARCALKVGLGSGNEVHSYFISRVLLVFSMDLAELQSDLDIVIKKEIKDLQNGSGARFLKGGNEKQLLEYPSAAVLTDLFSTVREDEKLKSFFIDFLSRKVRDDDEILYGQSGGGWSLTGVSQLCFYTLVELGFASEAIASLKKRINKCRGIYALLTAMIPESYFDDAQLREILKRVRIDDVGEYNEDYSLEEKISNL